MLIGNFGGEKELACSCEEGQKKGGKKRESSMCIGLFSIDGNFVPQDQEDRNFFPNDLVLVARHKLEIPLGKKGIKQT